MLWADISGLTYSGWYFKDWCIQGGFIQDVSLLQVIKAKYKLEDLVRSNLCLPPAPRRQCRHINEAALEGQFAIQCDLCFLFHCKPVH
jgi:hypothetical protein